MLLADQSILNADLPFQSIRSRTGQKLRNMCIDQPVPVRSGQFQKIPHVSLFRALSCHLWSSRWLNRDRTVKISTPVAAIRSSAANIRGMFSR